MGYHKIITGRGKSIKISVKIALLYFAIFSIVITAIVFVIYQVNIRSIHEKDVQILNQETEQISAELQSLINQVSFYSRVITADKNITDALKKCDKEKELEALDSLQSLLDNNTGIESIYIWDNYNNASFMDKSGSRVLKLQKEKIGNIAWYSRADSNKGRYILETNADKALTNSTSETTVSLIRIIYNPVDLKKIGIILINLNMQSINDIVESAIVGNNRNTYILDQNDVVIYSDSSIRIPELRNVLNEKKIVTFRKNGQKYLFANKTVENINWTIIAGESTGNAAINAERNLLSLLAVISGGGILFIIFYYVTYKNVALPLENLTQNMNQVENSHVSAIPDQINTSHIMEMEILINTYNDMAEKINALFVQIMKEEREKRKSELHILQLQLHPHFFYNTIDAISYLALSGKNEDTYDALEEFGNYYRLLLSNGAETITIKEEVDMLKDYLELESLRFGDLIRFNISCDQDIKDKPVLKMILQPIVENSIDHGIRPKETMGYIFTTIIRNGERIVIKVDDDGVGMTGEQLAKVLASIETDNGGSIGLVGTIKRLKIYYQSDFHYSIISSEGHGTSVTLSIPIVKMES